MAGHVFTAFTVIRLMNDVFTNFHYTELSSIDTGFVLKCRNLFRDLEQSCLDEEMTGIMNFYPEALISSRFSAEVESR